MTTCKRCSNSGEFYKTSHPGKHLLHGVCKKCIWELRDSEKKKVRHYLINEPDTKILCWKCKESKYILEFAPSMIVSFKVGFLATCRMCNNAFARETYKKKKDAEKLEKILKELL